MLSDKQIKNLKPKEKEYTVSDDIKNKGVGRLALRIRPSGAKDFFYIYYFKGKRKKLCLGHYKTKSTGLSLTEARDKVIEFSKLVSIGVCPKEKQEDERKKDSLAKRVEAGYGTLQDLCFSYAKWLKAHNKMTAIAIQKSFERDLFKPWPNLLNKKAKNIEADDIVKVISRMINRGVTTQTNKCYATFIMIHPCDSRIGPLRVNFFISFVILRTNFRDESFSVRLTIQHDSNRFVNHPVHCRVCHHRIMK